MDFLPGKMEKMVQDYSIENEITQESLIIEPCLENCEKMLFEPTWPE